MLALFSPKRSTQGFTLIELLIVVAIIAILVGILIPNFLRARTQGQLSASKGNMKNTATALESYYVDNLTYPPSLSTLLPTYMKAIPNDACVSSAAQFNYLTASGSYTLSTSWTGTIACSAALGVNGISYTPEKGLSTF